MTRAASRLCVAALVAAQGCASLGAQAGGRRVEVALDSVRVERPIDEVWSAARRLVGERGYALAGADAAAEGQEDLGFFSYFSRAVETTPLPGGGRRLETGWDRSRVRYVVDAIPDAGGWRVRFTAIHENLTEHGHDGWSERDLQLELELLQRLAPALAAEVRARAAVPGPAPEGKPPTP